MSASLTPFRPNLEALYAVACGKAFRPARLAMFRLYPGPPGVGGPGRRGVPSDWCGRVRRRVFPPRFRAYDAPERLLQRGGLRGEKVVRVPAHRGGEGAEPVPSLDVRVKSLRSSVAVV